MVRRVTHLTVVLAAAAAIFGAFSASALAGNVSITYGRTSTGFNIDIFGVDDLWAVYHFTATASRGYVFRGWTGGCQGRGICDYDSRVPSMSATAVFAKSDQGNQDEHGNEDAQH